MNKKEIQENFRKDFMELCKKYGVHYTINENYADISLYMYEGEYDIEDFEEIKFDECRDEEEYEEFLKEIEYWKNEQERYEKEYQEAEDEETRIRLDQRLHLTRQAIDNVSRIFKYKY